MIHLDSSRALRSSHVTFGTFPGYLAFGCSGTENTARPASFEHLEACD